MRLSNDSYTKKFRQQLRREATGCENILWHHLRGRQVLGLKFRRQHGYGVYVMDFYCPTIRLCIEVDGEVHHTAEAQQHDQERTEFLEQQGITVIRFNNEEVEDDVVGVINKITEFINNRDWGTRYVKTPNPLI